MLGDSTFGNENQLRIVPTPLHLLIGFGEYLVTYLVQKTSEVGEEAEFLLNTHINSLKMVPVLGTGLAQVQSLNGKEIRYLCQETSVEKMIGIFPDTEIYTEVKDNIMKVCAAMRMLFEYLLSDTCYETDDMLEQFKIDMVRIRSSILLIKQDTAKIHILLRHVEPFMEKYRTIGIFSETPLESFHSVMKKKLMLFRHSAKTMDVLLLGVLRNLIIENSSIVQLFISYPDQRICSSCTKPLRKPGDNKEYDDDTYCSCTEAVIEDIAQAMLMSTRMEEEWDNDYDDNDLNPLLDSNPAEVLSPEEKEEEIDFEEEDDEPKSKKAKTIHNIKYSEEECETSDSSSDESGEE